MGGIKGEQEADTHAKQKQPPLPLPLPSPLPQREGKSTAPLGRMSITTTEVSSFRPPSARLIAIVTFSGTLCKEEGLAA